MSVGFLEQPLEDAARFQRYDPSGLRRMMEQLPEQARDAWDAVRAWAPPPGFRPPGRVVLVGLGGSAIGPDVAATFATRAGRVPVQLVRDYQPPPLDESALLIASSFSGETEETLEAFEMAGQAGCMRVALAGGGRLARLAGRDGVPLFKYDWHGPPRTAIGHGVFLTIGILRALDAIEVSDAGIERAIGALESGVKLWGVDAPANEAKRLAEALHGRLPVAVGPDILAVAARRWSSELGENAKQWCFPYELPEFDHNQLEGIDRPAAADLIDVVLLDAPAVHPRNRRRVAATAAEIEAAGQRAHVAFVHGEEPLEAMLLSCSLASWVSYYLAMLNEVDPVATPRMAAFKGRLHAER